LPVAATIISKTNSVQCSIAARSRFV
jgi:hypothetical protein